MGEYFLKGCWIMKKRILIVDDNEPDIVLIEDSLQASGYDYKIIKVRDGQ